MNSTADSTDDTTESSVYRRYAAAAQAVEPALCCPVQYSNELLQAIPDEIIERDYGCGDPTPYVRHGETVLDLGSGGGKLCYIAAQVVGPQGRVIGVDCNREMLSLARKYVPVVAARLGYANVDFRYGLIQDLALDLDLLGSELASHPINSPEDYLSLRHVEERLRRDRPLVADDSIDCVLSNCVMNLVRNQDRQKLFAEIYRVLKRGGRAAISDIVCDEDVPEHMQNDPEMWSGCLSGAYREDKFLAAFEHAGFHGIELVKRESKPWHTVDGIEFRSVTVVAYKGKSGPCWERNQALMYRGPFKKVEDDDGHTYRRGERIAVCDKTFHLLQRDPYANMFAPVEPRDAVPLEGALPFDCRRNARRDPRESKGAGYNVTTADSDQCDADGAPCC